MPKPTLSVILPNYNDATYLEDSLGAILNQSYRAKEVIVIDDGSTDNSVEIIKRFIQRDPTVILKRNDKNQGILSVLNMGLHLAAGDYVYAGASNDKVLPGLFEKSMNILSKYPQAGMSCADALSLNTRNGEISKLEYKLSSKARYFSPQDLYKLLNRGDKDNIHDRLDIASNTVFMKRSALIEVGYYLPELKWHCDWFSHRVLAFRYGACYIPEPLGINRLDYASYSMVGMDNWKAQTNIVKRTLELLNSDKYKDVKYLFKVSAVISFFDREGFFVILCNIRYWDFFSIPFIKAAFGDLWRHTQDRITNFLEQRFSNK